jgi:chromosome segregation ATPase
LTQAVISARSGEYEALDRLEEYASGLVEADAALRAELNAERQRSMELDQVVKELQSDIETIRLESLANSKVRDAEANEQRRRFADERKTLQAEIDKTQQEATQAATRWNEVVAVSQKKLEESTALVEEWRTAAEEAQAQLQAEVARLEASLAKKEQIRGTIADENRRLLEANEKLHAENRRLVAQAAEAGNLSGESAQGPPSKKLAQAIEQNQMLHLDNVRLGNLVESAKIEADRRQKSLVLEIQRIKAEYEKLVSANEKLVDRVQELISEKMAMAEAMHASSGVRSVNPPPIASAIDVDEAELLANRSKEVELHRDIAFSMLYGDTMVEKRPGKNGH